jgi:branched-chain amino acid transport system substrate-binding protein
MTTTFGRLGRRPATRRAALIAVAALSLAACGRSDAAAVAGPLVIDATFPQSGPLAIVGAAGRGFGAYIAKVNDEGGVNGQKIVWNAMDDAYDPARMAANARKAVEQDRANVVVSFGGPSLSIRPYLNQNKTFHLVLAGNTPFSDVKQFPYSHAWYPDLGWESTIAAQYLKKAKPNAKVGVLGFNNDLTDSQAAGITVGGLTPALVLRVPPSQQDVTAQITQLKNAGVDTLFLSVGAGQVIGAVKYMQAVNYSPTIMMYSTTANRAGAIGALGGAAKGIYSTFWMADPGDALWASESKVADFKAAAAKYSANPNDANDALALGGYSAAEAVVAALTSAKAGDADGINTAWNTLKDVSVTGLPPGTSLNAGPGGRLVFDFQVVQFDGSGWKTEGDLVDAVTAGIAK